MKLYRTITGPLVESDGKYYRLPDDAWDDLINRDNLFEHLQEQIEDSPVLEGPDALPLASLLPPIGTQEVWAVGVNYTSSRAALLNETEAVGAQVFYRSAYHADRPQMFFKATHLRVAGPGGDVHIRRDSSWSIPEPELTLFITSSKKIVAYTIGNDMSSVSIEGENPLYLQQAKTHDACAALGPCLLVNPEPIDPKTRIQLSLRRGGTEIFSGKTAVTMIKRGFPELIDYLFRETSFPQGVFLMTGAGIAPPRELTLVAGDHITMTIDGIGMLENVVTQRS